VSDITQARSFAKRKHLGQLRKNGKTTTFSHLKDVVRNLKKMKVTDKEMICAAWLHDTIEDTDTDYDSIKDRFGKNIAEIVVSVTKDNRLPKKQREIKYVKDLKDSSAKAKLIKIADILANVNDAPNAGRNVQWEKQQFVKKSKYWNYVSGVKPGKLAQLSWANDEWNRLQEKYN
jgi:(p)ppGpp synthase/HD superfamily hydrolase